MGKTWEISVSNAAPAIKEALLMNAHVYVSHDSKSTGERSLTHHAGMRPIKALPWPLSKVQTHDVEFKVTGDRVFSDGCDRYTKEQIDIAIEYFLDRLSPFDLIRISVS